MQKAYDNLDLLRGVEVFLNTMPGASLYAMRDGLRSVGVDNQTATLFETLMDSKALFLTPNTEVEAGRNRRGEVSGKGENELHRGHHHAAYIPESLGLCTPAG